MVTFAGRVATVGSRIERRTFLPAGPAADGRVTVNVPVELRNILSGSGVSEMPAGTWTLAKPWPRELASMYQPVIVSAGLMPVGRVYPKRMVVDMEPGTSSISKEYRQGP